MKISDERLVATLIECGGSQKKAAKLLGVSAPTICNRLKTKSVKNLLAEQRRLILDCVSNKLIQSSTQAVVVLSDGLKSTNEYLRLTSAIKILNFAKELVQTEDILKRLDDLESKQN